MVVCVAAAGHLHAAQPQQAPPLGRLFFTPAERAQLDIARTQKKAPPVTAAAEPPAPQPAPQIVTYGGIVRRSDGRSTLWINNRAVDEKEALSALSLKGKVRPDGAVSVQVPQTGGTIDIKVGQSVELQTGRVAEARKPSPESKPAAEAAATEAKGTPEAKAPSQAKPAAETPPSATQAPQQPENPNAAGVGLKMDLGGRTLTPAESQRLSTAPR